MLRIDLPMDQIAALCEKWKITELAIFGSALRDDFGPDSDVDLLVTFEEDAPWDLFDFVDIKAEFAEVIGRDVDMVEKRAIKNPYRQRTILKDYEVLYETRRA